MTWVANATASINTMYHRPPLARDGTGKTGNNNNGAGSCTQLLSRPPSPGRWELGDAGRLWVGRPRSTSSACQQSRLSLDDPTLSSPPSQWGWRRAPSLQRLWPEAVKRGQAATAWPHASGLATHLPQTSAHGGDLGVDGLEDLLHRRGGGGDGLAHHGLGLT